MAAIAHAAVPCGAPWMHPGGQFVIESSSSTHKFTFDVLSFDKKDNDHCNGTIRMTTVFNFHGQSMQSHNMLLMAISKGIADLKLQQNTDSNVPGTAGVGTLQAQGLQQLNIFFSYAGEIQQAGQKLPATNSNASLNNSATVGESTRQMSIANRTLETTERTVGPQETLDTVAGKLDCWPVRYDMKENSGDMTIQGHTTKGAETVTHVVDHFCPSVNLVMRKDLTTDDSESPISEIVTSIQ